MKKWVKLNITPKELKITKTPNNKDCKYTLKNWGTQTIEKIVGRKSIHFVFKIKRVSFQHSIYVGKNQSVSDIHRTMDEAKKL